PAPRNVWVTWVGSVLSHRRRADSLKAKSLSAHTISGERFDRSEAGCDLAPPILRAADLARAHGARGPASWVGQGEEVGGHLLVGESPAFVTSGEDRLGEEIAVFDRSPS